MVLLAAHASRPPNLLVWRRGVDVRADYFYLTFFFDVAQCYLLLKAIKPDVLYINSGGYPGAVSCRATGIAGLLAGVKIIYFHVNSMPKPAPALFERLVDRLLIENVCRFITASPRRSRGAFSTAENSTSARTDNS